MVKVSKGNRQFQEKQPQTYISCYFKIIFPYKYMYLFCGLQNSEKGESASGEKVELLVTQLMYLIV